MENKKRHIVIALGDNVLDNILPGQMVAIKITAKATVDLIEGDCEVIVAHGNGPQVGMVNNVMAVLSREGTNQPNTPLLICAAVDQVYIGYDLQSTLREELYNREMHNIPAATMIMQIRVDAEDPAFDIPSKPIGHFMTEEQAKIAPEKYGYIIKEDVGRGCRRVVASPKPTEIAETDAVRSLVDPGQLVIACSGGNIPVIRQGNHLKGASAVIGRGSASELLTEELNADFSIILIAVEKIATNSGKPEERWLDNFVPDQAHVYMEEGHFAPGSMLPKVQAAVKFTESKDGRTALITLLERAEEEIQGLAGTHVHQQS